MAELPDDIEREDLEELAEQINMGHMYVLQDLMYEQDQETLRKRIEPQVDDADQVIADMTSDMCYKQRVEISEHLDAKFRTIPARAQDRALQFARRESEYEDEFGRLLARRRLSYVLISYNGNEIGQDFQQSLYDIQMSGSDPIQMLTETADDAFQMIGLMPESISNRLSQAFGIWEQVVEERVENTDLQETIKN